MITELNSEIILCAGFMYHPESRWLNKTRPEWFDNTDLAILVASMQKMDREGLPFDLVSIARSCPEVGYGYTSEVYSAYSGQELSFHWAMVRQEWTKRHGGKVVRELANRLESEADPFKVLKDLQSHIDILQLTQTIAPIQIYDLMKERAEGLKARMNREIKSVGLPTGFYTLDKYIGGFVPGEVVVVAGRPAMGKTAFAVSLGLSHAKQNGRVMMFSLEMSKEQSGDRLLSMVGQVENQRIRRAEISDHELQRIFSSIETCKLDFSIDTSATITIDQIRSAVKVANPRPTLVILDYMQLVSTDGKSNREQQISYISRQCKMIAKDCGCTVMPLSQLNRDIKDGNPRPRLENLRESGAIEQDADTVLFPFRPQYYSKQTPDDVERDCELIISKCRNGITGHIEMAFRGATVEYLW